MKVVHLSTADVAGGAARAAYRLHDGLKRAGHTSSMLVRDKASGDGDIHQCASQARWEALQIRLRRRGVAQEEHQISSNLASGSDAFSTDRSTLGSLPLSRLGRPDVVNLHFVAGLLDFSTTLVQMSSAAPLVWTLHDMNPFTGGCHYSAGCDRFNAGCGSCPLLTSTDPHDLSQTIWQRKNQTYSRIAPERLHIVTLCRWMNDLVRGSALLSRFPSTIIPNGLDTQVFAPIEKPTARAALHLPRDAQIVLFVAASVGSHRKGFQQLVSAMPEIAGNERVCLVSVGGQCPDVAFSSTHRHLGNVGDERLMSLIYNAADLFVIPSLEDNLPNTVMEAMACGTPVVGFDVGGIPDMVRHEQTGLLAKSGDTAALGQCMCRLLDNADLARELGESARRVVEDEYSLKRQAEQYVALYQQLID